MFSMIPIRVFSDMVTEKCNLNCTYCFEHCKSGKSKKAIDSYNYMSNYGNRDIIPSNNMFTIGGEPFLNKDYITDLNNLINNHVTLTENHKNKLIRANNSVITNGTLIDKNIEFIKNNNLHLQISMDGNKEVHDKNRVDYNNEGSWDTIINNIDILEKNNYNNYSIHSVLSSTDFDKFFDVVKYHISFLIKRGKPLDVGHNLVSLVIESEVTDDQIDIFIKQMYKAVKYILFDDELNNLDTQTRKQMAVNFLSKRGSSVCSAGSTMFILDSENKVFGCHRLCTFDDKDLELYSIEDNKIKNIDMYLQFIKYKDINYQYGPYKIISKNNPSNESWTYTCCATSYNIGENCTTNPSKFNTLEAELSRAILYIADLFDIDLYSKGDKTNER